MKIKVGEEIRRLLKKDLRSLFRGPTTQTIKKAWVEQGIWRSNWHENIGQGVGVRWKHEDPLLQEPKDDEERRRLEREREALRPLLQFLYQVGKTCEHLLAKYQANELPAAQEPPDLATVAYYEVKKQWTKWGIWSNKWGVLPGRT